MTTGSPKVTVVIPTYNRSRYLSQALASVLQQTISDYEVIVVDDGSTDDTQKIVAAYSNVRYIRTENGGPAHARNVGMQLARGHYIAFLDSDDLYHPYKLELQSRLLDRYPVVGMVYTELSAFDDSGFSDSFHLRTYHRSAFWNAPVTYDHIFAESVGLAEDGLLPAALRNSGKDFSQRKAYFGNIFDAYLLRTIVFTNSMMFRRRILDEVGPQDESFRYFEELEFALRICRTHKVCFVDIPTYKLRYHQGQMSNASSPRGGYVAIRKQQSLLRAVKRHALQDTHYYVTHKKPIDARLARLHRAVAIPMLAYDGDRARLQISCTRRARVYLAGCRRYGLRTPVLWYLSFSPRIVRRLAFGLMDRLKDRRPRHQSTAPRPSAPSEVVPIS
jgi:glycosyltransferase involved in cell wall biosynthesis